MLETEQAAATSNHSKESPNPDRRTVDSCRIEQLRQLPENWALTPLRGKGPYRRGWQTEAPVSRELIAGELERGNATGFGLRTGEVSGGILAIDVDGPSADPLLQALGSDTWPDTVQTTSGKPGRRQLLYKIPSAYREQFQDFTRATLSQWGEVQAEQGEQLEFRYNRQQSALPGSWHPDTGGYRWVRSPDAIAIAEAPPELLELLEQLAEGKQRERKARHKAAHQRQQQQVERRKQRQQQDAPAPGSIEDAIADATDHLGVDGIYDWNGHQFHTQAGELVGYCPQHGGESGTAFQVNPETFEWWCHSCEVGGGPIQYRDFARGGSGSPHGKDFIELAKELCQQAGVTFPEQQQGRARQISADEHARDHGLPNWLRRLVERAKGTFKGFGDSQKDHVGRAEAAHQQRQALAADTAIEYEPGCLPWFGEPEGRLPQVLVRSNKDAKLAYAELVQKRWGYVLDSTPPGLGKSTRLAELRPDQFGCQRLIHESASARNPTVRGLEEGWTLIPARARGDDLVQDNNRRTERGSPFIRRTREDERGDMQGTWYDNCRHPEAHQALQGLNLGLEGSNSSKVKRERDSNPICASCEALEWCKASGFKAQSREALQQERLLRGTPEGTPSDAAYQAGLLFDDVAPQALKTLAVNPAELARSFEYLHEFADALDVDGSWGYAELRDELERTVRRPLERLLVRPELVPAGGLDTTALRGQLQGVQQLAPELLDRLHEFELLQRKAVKSAVKDAEPSELNDAITGQPVQWLRSFLEVLRDEVPGALHLESNKDGGQLTITTRNEARDRLIANAEFVLVADGTQTRDRLAAELECDPAAIAEVKMPTPAYTGLKIRKIELPGVGRNAERSERAQQKVDALKGALAQEVGGDDWHSVIDWLKNAAPGELAHFSGGRGTNELQHARALTLIGIPYQNLTATRSEFETFQKREAHLGRHRDETDPALQSYIDAKWQSEVIQEAHRLRPARRPDEPLTINLVVPPGTDLTFLEREFGTEVRAVDPCAIAPEAGTANQQIRWRALQAIAAAIQVQGRVPTQEEAVEYLDFECARSRISHAFEDIPGGWMGLKRFVKGRIRRPLGTFTKRDLVSDDEVRVFLDLPPIEAAGHVAKFIANNGLAHFERILDSASIRDELWILGHLLAVLPGADFNSLRAPPNEPEGAA